MYLFFDTETTGLPRNFKAPASDSKNWPRMVQIAWILTDENGNKILSENYIIKPDGYSIPDDVARIHGITTERALNEGVELKTTLERFQDTFKRAKYLIAHNISFDEKIYGAECYRIQLDDGIKQLKKICTMLSSTDYCKIPGPYGNKWPNLSELHKKLFKESFNDAHNAAVDVQILSKCFFKLKELKVINHN